MYGLRCKRQNAGGVGWEGLRGGGQGGGSVKRFVPSVN